MILIIRINANAKINLSLDVVGKRPDGYHDVKMIMQTIALHDTITLEEISQGIEITANHPHIPVDSTNSAYKAAKILFERFRIARGIRIHIDKKIPVAAGLAGGSADAAAVLRAMNKLFEFKLTLNELLELAANIGADVPFCIQGGTQLAEGKGEILSPLPTLPKTDILLVKPQFGAPTAWVYGNLNLDKVDKRPDYPLLFEALQESKIDVLAKHMTNVLESVTEQKHPIIRKIKEELLCKGAIGSMMSGSGSTVFGIFPNRETALQAKHALKERDWYCHLTHTER